jgi:hypothetical protein
MLQSGPRVVIAQTRYSGASRVVGHVPVDIAEGTTARLARREACFSVNRVGPTCLTAIAAAALTPPVTWAALTRKPGARNKPRDSLFQAFRKADTRARVEVIFALLSFLLAITTGVLIAAHIGKATTRELTCTYITGSVFEIVGILVTVTQLMISWAGTEITGTWSKSRGPAFLIIGIVLGLFTNIAWLHTPAGYLNG